MLERLEAYSDANELVVAAFAFFGWSIKRAGGIGPIVHQKNTIHGSELGWAFVNGIMSSIANFAALICNSRWLSSTISIIF